MSPDGEWVECVAKAIERTEHEYACNGDHDSDLIANALERLSINLRAEIETLGGSAE